VAAGDRSTNPAASIVRSNRNAVLGASPVLRAHSDSVGPAAVLTSASSASARPTVRVDALAAATPDIGYPRPSDAGPVGSGPIPDESSFHASEVRCRHVVVHRTTGVRLENPSRPIDTGS
jgi:hypothetical protein